MVGRYSCYLIIPIALIYIIVCEVIVNVIALYRVRDRVRVKVGVGVRVEVRVMV